MTRKNVIPRVEPRPQRSMRAKKVFDPSDNYLPKKRNKTSTRFEKPNEISKKKKHIKFRSSSVNESLDSISNDNTTSPLNSPSNSPVKQNSPEYENEVPYKSDICCKCSNDVSKPELVDCPICLIKAHQKCIIIEEPMWKHKLDKCAWLCEQCRQKHCSKCLKDESYSEIIRRCLTCKVGLHFDCYESYDIKPLQALRMDMYICIPCMTLAVEKQPEELEDEIATPCSSVKSFSSSCKSNTSDINPSSDQEDDDLQSITSLKLCDYEHDDDDEQLNCLNPYIPDSSKWSKYEVFEYLSDRLPKEVLVKVIKNDIDGSALKLLRRTDITLGMDLKVGPALKFYKEVRILQTQSTHHSVFWE